MIPRLLRLVALAFTLAVLAVIGLGGYLLFAGGGSRPDCAPPEGTQLAKVTQSIAFDVKVAGFLVASQGGFLQSISLSESESAARAESYFDSRISGFSDVAFCFEDSGASGFVRVNAFLGRKIGINGTGSLDLSGQHPRLRLDSARIAGVSLPGPLRKRIESRANHELDDIPIFIPLNVTFSKNLATLTR
jgi:hypothetical protein